MEGCLYQKVMDCEISGNFYELPGISLQNLCMCLQECYTKYDICAPDFFLWLSYVNWRVISSYFFAYISCGALSASWYTPFCKKQQEIEAIQMRHYFVSYPLSLAPLSARC